MRSNRSTTTGHRRGGRQHRGAKAGTLAKALLDGKLIIVVTIQPFPFAMKAIRENRGLKGKTFAVIADEAHSSKPQTAAQLKAVLTAEEIDEINNGGEVDIEAALPPKRPSAQSRPASPTSHSPQPGKGRHWSCSAAKPPTVATWCRSMSTQ